jgi:hypothetical protein
MGLVLVEREPVSIRNKTVFVLFIFDGRMDINQQIGAEGEPQKPNR